MSRSQADKLDEVVAELVRHGHDDLPEGPPSPLGGEARPNQLKTRPESEIRLLAERGQAIVERRIALRASEGS